MIQTIRLITDSRVFSSRAMASEIKGFLPEGGKVIVDQIAGSLAQTLGLPLEASIWLALAGIALITCVLGLVLLRTLFGSSGKKKQRGSDLLILGHCNAGKTCLFYQLKAQTFPETVSSLEVKQEELPIKGLQSETTVKVVDFPGHARLRGELPGYLKGARGILFLVDATDTAQQNIMRETADLLYDVLTGCIRAGNEPRILVVCNKHDKAEAVSSKAIKAALEKEM